MLSCQNLKVKFRNHEVLSGINLSLERGEWVGIVGPNGAGKSTLLRALIGLSSFDGSVELADGRLPTATDIAMVPQSPLLPVGMTVAEYVLLGRTAHLGWLARESRKDHAIVTAVLDRLNLSKFANRLLTTLSGGEAQQVVIARTLAQQCPILLLDEPTSSLDLGHQVDVLETVDSLRCNEGISVLAAMHDLGAAARFANRLLLMQNGQIVAEGTPSKVLQAELLSQVYGTAIKVQRIEGELVVLAAPRRQAVSNSS